MTRTLRTLSVLLALPSVALLLPTLLAPARTSEWPLVATLLAVASLDIAAIGTSGWSPPVKLLVGMACVVASVWRAPPLLIAIGCAIHTCD